MLVGVHTTWRALDTTRDAPVRLTRLPRPDVTRDLTEHLRALRALANVGIARVLEGGLDDDGAWIVTELLDGQRSLAHWLAGHRAARSLPSLATAQRLVERVGAALRVVHESRGTIKTHGALCARNVLLRRLGGQHAVQLLGVGDAQLSRTTCASEHLRPYLASSDQGAAEPSTTTDLFALAVLQAELLTGLSTPTSTERWSEVARGGVRRVRAVLRGVRDDVPDGVVEVIARAMHPSVAERHATAALLLRALRDAWGAVDRAAPPGPTEPEPPAPEATALVDPAPRDSSVPVGWQEAERAPTKSVAAEPEEVPRPRTVRVDLAGAFLAIPGAAPDGTRRVAWPRPTDEHEPTEELPIVAGTTEEMPRAIVHAVAPLDVHATLDDHTAPEPVDEDDATHALPRPAQVRAFVAATAALGEISPFGVGPRPMPRDDANATDRVLPSEVDAARRAIATESTKTQRIPDDAMQAALTPEVPTLESPAASTTDGDDDIISAGDGPPRDAPSRTPAPVDDRHRLPSSAHAWYLVAFAVALTLAVVAWLRR